MKEPANVSVVPATDVESLTPGGFIKDDHELEQMGYKQEFKRQFSVFTVFCLSFAVTGLFVGISGSLYATIGYSGFAGLVYAWPVACIFVYCVALSMSELASAWPTAGGLYYASYQLAPEGYKAMCAWFVGWANLSGQFTTAPSTNWIFAQTVLSCAGLFHDYEVKTWHAYLLYLAAQTMHAVLACVPTKYLSYTNTFGAILQVALIFIFIIVMPAATEHVPKFNSSSDVWGSGTMTNGTGWPMGFAFIMSFLVVLFCLAGIDAPFHMSEECTDAARSVPRAISWTVLSTAVFGYAVCIVFAYTMFDAADILATYGQPLAGYLVENLNEKGATAMVVICCMSIWTCGMGCFTASSRMAFAYSRDGALPFSKWICWVHPKTKTPMRSVFIVWCYGALLGLLAFASSTAINAVFSLVSIAQFMAFTLPIAIKLWAYYRGENTFKPGPWNLGRWSIAINWVAVVFVAFLVPVLCFPAGPHVDANTMNYTGVIYLGIAMFSAGYWILSARKWFKGPVNNVSPNSNITYTTPDANSEGTGEKAEEY